MRTPRATSRWLVIGAVLASGLSLSTACAGLLDSEGFNYSPGDVVGQSGGTGWSSFWTNPVSGGIAPWGLQTTAMGNRKNDASVVAPGLNYSGFATSGNALNVGNLSTYRSWDASKLFTSTGQSLWVSFLVTPISGGAASTMYVVPFAQNNPAVAADYQKGSGARFNTGPSSWTVTLDIPGTQNGSGYTTPATRSLTMDQANLIVIQFNYNGAGTDTIQLWVNPTLGGSAPLGSDPSTTTGNGWLDQLGEFMVKSGTGVTATFDEINIGDTYADVTPLPVPEPGMSSLLVLSGIGAGCAALRRRIRK